jgi:hypothetical protein
MDGMAPRHKSGDDNQENDRDSKSDECADEQREY